MEGEAPVKSIVHVLKRNNVSECDFSMYSMSILHKPTPFWGVLNLAFVAYTRKANKLKRLSIVGYIVTDTSFQITCSLNI